tara:strand:+ start:13063 stop:13551 length:489 start_codon:yes stop_codon:yes gene_type:complete
MTKGRKGTRFEIEGDEELIKKLNAMSKGFRSKALVYALTQGAEIIEREAKARAPKRTGLLRRAITTITLKSGSKLAKVAVGWRNTKASQFPAFYGIMQEKGTKNRQRKSWRKVELKTGTAPTGTGPPNAFLIPAYDAKRRDADRAIKVQLDRLIRKAVKKGL